MMVKKLRNQEKPGNDMRSSRDAKLLAYCAVAGGALLAAQPADAGIVYSGVKNLSLSDNKTVGVDLDSNGVVDFSFVNLAGKSTFTTQKIYGPPTSTTFTYTHFRNFQSNILNLGINPQNAIAHKGPLGVPVDPEKVRLGPGSGIPGEGISWLDAKRASVVPLSYHAFTRVLTTSTMTTGTDFFNKVGGAFFNKAGFLGVRFQIDNGTHYGWLRYQGAADDSSTDNITDNRTDNGTTLKATIVDWAYEDIPLQPIYAEQVPPLCTVTLTPGRISKIASLINPFTGIIIRGDDNATFTKDTRIDWGTDSVKTLFKIRLGKTIFALVRVRPLLLQGSDTFLVTVGDCIGELNVGPF